MKNLKCHLRKKPCLILALTVVLTLIGYAAYPYWGVYHDGAR